VRVVTVLPGVTRHSVFATFAIFRGIRLVL